MGRTGSCSIFFEGVAVAATSGSVLAVDSKMRPLSRILLYSDKRAQEETASVREKKSTGRTYEPYLPLDAVIPKILWLGRNMPNFSEVNMILNETDYIQAKLTGEICSSPSVAGKAHIDVRSESYIPEIFHEVGIQLSLLPPIQPIGFIIGSITDQASRETGLPKQLSRTLQGMVWRGYQALIHCRYSEEQLQEWVPRVNEVAGKAKKVAGYFNNQLHGYAPENVQIMEMLGSGVTSLPPRISLLHCSNSWRL